MADVNTFEFEPTSRHQLTNVYRRGGRLHFGIFKAPDIKLDGDEETIAVTEATKGNLDILAYNAYGDRRFFWAIGLVNKISNPPDDVVPGVNLIIPKLERVLEALEER